MHNLYLEGGANCGRPNGANLEKGFACRSRSSQIMLVCPLIFYLKILRRETMKVKINEDWLATFIAFALLILAMVNLIKPDWVKF